MTLYCDIKKTRLHPETELKTVKIYELVDSEGLFFDEEKKDDLRVHSQTGLAIPPNYLTRVGHSGRLLARGPGRAVTSNSYPKAGAGAPETAFLPPTPPEATTASRARSKELVARSARKGHGTLVRGSELLAQEAKSTRPISVLLGALLMLSMGCFGPTAAVDGRTALEQELTRLAIEGAVKNLPLHVEALKGTWRLTITAPNAKDLSWIRSCLQLRLAQAGVKLSDDPDAELSEIEARVLMAGSDIDNFAVGLPVSLAEGKQTLSLYQSITEYGRAAISLVFRPLGSDAPMITPEINHRVHYSNQYFLTIIGPISSNDIREKTWGRFLELGRDSYMSAKRQGEWIFPGEEQQEIKRSRGR